MRKIQVEIPSDYCNSCIFYLTGDWRQSHWYHRTYWCKLFEKDLKPDHNKIHCKKSLPTILDDEYKVIICDECKNKYK